MLFLLSILHIREEELAAVQVVVHDPWIIEGKSGGAGESRVRSDCELNVFLVKLRT